MSTKTDKTIPGTNAGPLEGTLQIMDDQYGSFVLFGERFIKAMLGSNQLFSDRQQNYLAVENAIKGHILSQPWFPEDDDARLFEHVGDSALQAAVDATANYWRFKA